MVCRHEFPRDQLAPSRARAAVSALDPAPSGLPWEDATLLVSELVTNSVVHGTGETVELVIDDDRPDRLRCEVVDGGNGFVPGPRSDHIVGGWGLELVERLCSRWGVRVGPTHVWFELEEQVAS